MKEQRAGAEEGGSDWDELADEPLGALDVIACLVGQMDGEVFVPRRAVAMLRGRTVVTVFADIARDGYVVKIAHAEHDGTSSTWAGLHDREERL